MNKVILMGRLTRDPDVRYSAGENSTAVARYTLAVDRRFRRDGDSATADFIGCVALVVEEQEFAESKNAGGNNGGYSAPQHNNPAPSANTSDLGSADGFMNIPDGIDEELPFN